VVLVSREGRRSLILALGWAWIVMAPHLAVAHPIERFESSLEVECSEGATCDGVARSEASLGRYLGVLISRRGRGEASVEVDTNEGLKFEAMDLNSASLTLSWDADPHPDRLSGAGLNCFDLTRNAAYALIVSDVHVESECQELGHEGGCPVIAVESRIYDARDPTGQRFSASVMERTFVDGGNLVIPFSNFLREGPRGKADLSCVGAVTISFQFNGFDSVEFQFGPIYTNGTEGLTPAPTVTPVPSPTLADTPVPQFSPTSIPSPTAVSTPERFDSPGSIVEATIAAESSARPSVDITVGQTPNPLPTRAVMPAIPAGVEEEVTYGEVVEQAE